MSDSVRPSLLNKICAHPEIIACVPGAIGAHILGYCALGGTPLRAILPDWQSKLYFVVLAIPAATLLGCFFSLCVFGLLVANTCRKINGAPYKFGDEVMILSGPHKGTVKKVWDITVGQGGWNLACIDFGPEHKVCWKTYEEYSLFRIRRSEGGRADDDRR